MELALGGLYSEQAVKNGIDHHKADLLVYATGYGSMNGWLADLISPEIADKVGKCWGLGSDTPVYELAPSHHRR
ncbi:hypothetical protein SRS16P3_00395 (plasmid) [Variovorax sp. SRS16]|uniref:hypothetical protein n=1 Tax=Variovorax sp. SRS16 TaxID=282217 RepID=UPI001316D89A|nr:hypothetical protein [Variovorax sp. SRS16]VTU46683.1 hypothetical protein SRS16P3_00395 [Variovorax sp. SRS16]